MRCVWNCLLWGQPSQSTMPAKSDESPTNWSKRSLNVLWKRYEALRPLHPFRVCSCSWIESLMRISSSSSSEFSNMASQVFANSICCQLKGLRILYTIESFWICLCWCLLSWYGYDSLLSPCHTRWCLYRLYLSLLKPKTQRLKSHSWVKMQIVRDYLTLGGWHPYWIAIQGAFQPQNMNPSEFPGKDQRYPSKGRRTYSMKSGFITITKPFATTPAASMPSCRPHDCG